MSKSLEIIIEDLINCNDIRTYILENITNISIDNLLYKSTCIDVGTRPWGVYKVIYGDDNSKIKLKLIFVNPHSELSYQSHNYRNEHWIHCIGNGIARLEDLNIVLESNNIIYIPAEYKHQLINNSDEKLIIFEIQEGILDSEGKYNLSEDDIYRYSDLYDRITR